MANRPNFLVIIADDLGFSDVGCFGGEIATPNLDKLAQDGTRLLNYHTAAACSPTRAMLLTGTDAHLAGLGVLIEYKAGPQGEQRYAGKAGYEGFLNNEVAPVSEILQDNGYYTMLAGKWHLGLRPEYGPSSRGFDRSFSLLPGCCNHYGWEPQLEGMKAGMPLGGRPLHAEDGKKVDVKPNRDENEGGFYSSDTYTDKLLQYLQERTPEEAQKPFFAYHAFSAPHWPNQAPKKLREKYIDTYSDGPDALRTRRLTKLKEMGIIAEDVAAHEVVAPEVAEWEHMSEYERKCSSRSMAAYAAMVEQMDHNIGRVIDYLQETGAYDNTVILFMSDNGAEGAAIEAAPVLGDRVLAAIQQFYDNSLENIGNWNSFTWIGPRWAQASTAPSRLYKCWPSEGGILVPAILKLPSSHGTSSVKKGDYNRSFTTCMDIAPTLLEMAQVKLPEPTVGKFTHRGKKVHAIRGKSLVPYFMRGELASPSSNESTAVHTEDSTVGWELFGRAALRQGKWKIVHLEKSHGGAGEGDEGWELFNLEEDPGETLDLASSNPEKLAHMLDLWSDYVATSQVVWGETAAQRGVSKEEAPLWHDSDMDQQRSWMQAAPGSLPVFG